MNNRHLSKKGKKPDLVARLKDAIGNNTKVCLKERKLNERQLFILPECSQSKIKLFNGIITSEEEWKHTSGALTEMDQKGRIMS